MGQSQNDQNDPFKDVSSQQYYTSLEFVENQGQWEGPFKYQATTNHGDVYLETHGFTFLVGADDNDANLDAYHHGYTPTPPVLKFHSYNLIFEGSNTPAITGSKQEEFYCNYFLGKDKSKWKTKIHPCLAVDYANLYNGIDMHVSSDKGNMEYELVVNPESDASQIQVRYKGQSSLKLQNGNLIVGTSVGPITELKPYAYQYVNGILNQVSCKYKLKNDLVTYSFPDDYDKSKPLIIDPTVVFATFSGSVADNWGYTATYDEHGNFYNGGIVHYFDSSSTFIVTPGAFQGTFKWGVDDPFSDYIVLPSGFQVDTNRTNGTGYSEDIGLVKYNSTGSTRIWATFLGGSNNETPHSLIVDSSDNLIIAGRTYSHDFPVTAGSYDTSFNGGNCDIFVTKLDESGGSLIGSTYVGGSGDDGVNFHPAEFMFGNLKHNYGDDARSEVLIDKKQNIYVTASTLSTDFPVTSDAYQKTLAGGQDAVIFKLNSDLSSLLWSTYLGGSQDDAGYVLDLDTDQSHLYVAGGTMSSNFPSTSGTLNPTFLGGIDGFLVKFLNSPPYTFQRGTFIGTNDTDQVYGVQVDLSNGVYVMGQSLGGHFPVTSGVYNNPHSTQFVMKIDSNLTTDIFSTIYGSGDSTHTNISPVAFLVDTCENIYISGWGGVLIDGLGFPSSTGSTNDMPITSDAAQKTTDGHDFYFIVFSKNALTLLYATYMGGTGRVGEHVDGGTSRFDKNGVVYQAICGGCGGSSSFPTTAGAWSTTNKSSNCNEIALKIAFNLSAVKAKANASPSTKGCVPFTVHFNDSTINATSYSWDFADGGTDTVKEPTHTFNSGGVFNVRLVAFNPNACKELDTVFIKITVDTNNIQPAFTYKILDSCKTFTVAFTNTSGYSTPGDSAFTKFVWFYGDGNSFNGENSPVHAYPSAGTYTADLVMIDTTACNSPDTVKQTFQFNGLRVAAGFGGPDSLCKSSTATFTDSSVNGTTYQWYFGDGQSASTNVPAHEYDSVGTFIVTEIVSNPSSCNGSDTFRKKLVVLPIPFAAFIDSPTIPVTNVPTYFTNQSVNATSYLWDFGDGATSKLTNPSHFFKKTGSYNVCLEALNNLGCSARVCQQVSSDVLPLADVPTGFSPNGDGSNDILYVRGAAIATLDFRVYNRWGEMVFETKDQSIGWDGTYKGQPQPIDAYAYILNVSFVDGTSLQKKGNVTLLR